MLDADYWESRYQNKTTGWDIGYVSTPIKNYLDRIQNKDVKILIPGAGRAYEAEYAFHLGFENVFVVDFAQSALDDLKLRVPEFADNQLIASDFFDVEGEYDVIIEQTFFCALDPLLREKYAEKMRSLLKAGGKLVGLLFNDDFQQKGPPFGGSLQEYQVLFEKHFSEVIFKEATDSIDARKSRELWMECYK